MATHFEKIMKLEKIPGFRNFKVYIIEKENGKIQFTFKVIAGKSDQKIAFRILRQQGVSVGFLEKKESSQNVKK